MLIEVEGLSKRYAAKGPMVVENVTFSVDHGETAAIFGESGSGKSTIGQMVAGFFPPTEGTIRFNGGLLRPPYRGEVRRRIQILFQHPEVAFNPRMTLLESLREPYRFFKIPFSRTKLCAYLERFGIYLEHLDRYPEALSGGELQRLALARVMLLEPDFLVLDEPTSMLDVISQAQMIHLLQGLQKERGTGYLFISHDLELCQQFCSSIYPLENGSMPAKKILSPSV